MAGNAMSSPLSNSVGRVETPAAKACSASMQTEYLMFLLSRICFANVHLGQDGEVYKIVSI